MRFSPVSTRRILPIAGLVLFLTQGAAAKQKPNIPVIFGGDIGELNISAYTHGLVGYMTPNIDRIVREGVMFTDYYAENSRTAGRSSFINGQSRLRTGLSKVGAPGAPARLQKGDMTIAQAIKPLGYATAQFGKNYLGDRDEYLPTNHGFDEFFGNLYHLNAEEEPERADWPKNDPVSLKNKAGKPVGIDKFIDRRPIAAFGNSDGDQQMLEWTAAGGGKRLMLLVHHTDAGRGYAYDRQSSVGTLDKALDEANAKSWVVVDTKRGWRTIFP